VIHWPGSQEILANPTRPCDGRHRESRQEMGGGSVVFIEVVVDRVSRHPGDTAIVASGHGLDGRDQNARDATVGASLRKGVEVCAAA
jgi:hypothetical protein